MNGGELIAVAFSGVNSALLACVVWILNDLRYRIQRLESRSMER